MLTWGNSVTPETSKMLSAALSVSTSMDATLDTTESAFLVMRWCTFCTRKMLSLNYPQAFIKSHVRHCKHGTQWALRSVILKRQSCHTCASVLLNAPR